jgi:adenine phosphoribosyltransferase
MSRAMEERLRRTIRFIDGHVDTWSALADSSLFGAVTRTLAAPFESQDVTKIAAVEARGFVLGAAVAIALGAGFIPIRKDDGFLPGDKAQRRTEADWRGRHHLLRIQRQHLTESDRVVLVDDWVETGSQALAAKALIEECHAHWAGASVLVADCSEEVATALAPFHSLINSEQLEQD